MALLLQGDSHTASHICEEITTIILFLPSTRVEKLVAEISRQKKELALILQLVMWIRKILFAIGVHKLMFPFMHAGSPTDTFNNKKLTESCCIVFRLKVFQKKELLVDRFRLRVFQSLVQKKQDENYGFD